jgi:hypothetical protein
LQLVSDRKRRQLRERRLQTMAALTRMAEHVARELTDPAGGRLASLARGLLAFSGKQTLELQPVDVNHQVAAMDVRLCEILGEHVKLVQQLAPELPPAKTDPSQLQFVLLTLASFACRRMPQGGTFRISTRGIAADDPVLSSLNAPQGRYVRLTLQDDGGILDSRGWEHLFEPFDGGENGLAMAAAYGIIKQCGGYVSASGGDRGVTFAVYLPSAEHHVTALDKRRVEAAAVRETIVLFEGEEGLRHLVRNLLARRGYKVLEAGDEDAVRRIFAQTHQTIDLLIANVNSSTLAYNMALAHSRVKLIYLSESNDTVEERPGPLPPDAAVLQKPFRLDALLAKIRSVLDNKPSAR